MTSFHCQTLTHQHHDSTRGKYAWYDDKFPPLALWVAGADDLVDGRRLLRRFDRGREPHVRVVHKKIIEGYEHLDVIWALDAIEKVGKEVREVIWRTADHDAQLLCRTPVGCEKPLEEDPDISKDVPMMHSGGRMRMASISEAPPALAAIRESLGDISEDANSGRVPSITRTDRSREVQGEHEHVKEDAEKFGNGPKSGAQADPETKYSTVSQTDGAQDRANGPQIAGRSRKLSEAVFTDLQEKGNPMG